MSYIDKQYCENCEEVTEQEGSKIPNAQGTKWKCLKCGKTDDEAFEIAQKREDDEE